MSDKIKRDQGWNGSPEPLRKVLDFEVKEVGDRVLEFNGSTETVDRYGDIIKADGWNLKNYKRNPVFLWAHRYEMPPIGKAVKVWIEEDKLKFKIEFPDDSVKYPSNMPSAETVYQLYKGGFLKATSVGFDPKEWENIEEKKDKDDEVGNVTGRMYLKQELLELSAVPVPANPDALMNAYEERVISKREMKKVDEWIHRSEISPVSDVIESGESNEVKKVTKPEENEKTIRIPVQGEGGKHENHAIRWITVSKSKGISGIYCIDDKKIITYVFDKEKGWTMESAKEWVKEHSKSLITVENVGVSLTTPVSDMQYEFIILEDLADLTEQIQGTSGTIDPHQEKVISQVEIQDDLDFIKERIEVVGLNQESQLVAWNLVESIFRQAGDDIPDNIFKAGAVLNSKNKGRLNGIRKLAQEVLDSASTSEGEEGKSISEVTEDNMEEVKALISSTVKETIRHLLKNPGK